MPRSTCCDPRHVPSTFDVISSGRAVAPINPAVTSGGHIVSSATDGFRDAELRDQPTDLPGLYSEHGELSVYDADE